VAANEGLDNPPQGAQRKPEDLAGPARAREAARWWQNPSLQSAAAVLIAVTAGLALAIGISLVALALASADKNPPPLVLSVTWSAAAAISFSSSLAYLLVDPRRALLLRIASMMALAMLFSVAVLVLRNG
jgi:hypothetical protein